MALQRSVVALGALSLSLVLLLSSALLAVALTFGRRLNRAEESMDSARQRIADLELENDYLFEDREGADPIKVLG